MKKYGSVKQFIKDGKRTEKYLELNGSGITGGLRQRVYKNNFCKVEAIGEQRVVLRPFRSSKRVYIDRKQFNQPCRAITSDEFKRLETFNFN